MQTEEQSAGQGACGSARWQLGQVAASARDAPLIRVFSFVSSLSFSSLTKRGVHIHVVEHGPDAVGGLQSERQRARRQRRSSAVLGGSGSAAPGTASSGSSTNNNNK